MHIAPFRFPRSPKWPKLLGIHSDKGKGQKKRKRNVFNVKRNEKKPETFSEAKHGRHRVKTELKLTVSRSPRAGENLQQANDGRKQKRLKSVDTKLSQSTKHGENINLKVMDALIFKRMEEWFHNCGSSINKEQNNSPFGCSSLTRKVLEEYSVSCISFMYFFKSFPC